MITLGNGAALYEAPQELPHSTLNQGLETQSCRTSGKSTTAPPRPRLRQPKGLPPPYYGAVPLLAGEVAAHCAYDHLACRRRMPTDEQSIQVADLMALLGRMKS
jgi:hypothetical protein